MQPSKGVKLTQLTERILTRIKRLPKRECSYYKTAFCHPCKVEQGGRCAYFENVVLPLAPELSDEYRRVYKGRS